MRPHLLMGLPLAFIFYESISKFLNYIVEKSIKNCIYVLFFVIAILRNINIIILKKCGNYMGVDLNEIDNQIIYRLY